MLRPPLRPQPDTHPDAGPRALTAKRISVTASSGFEIRIQDPAGQIAGPMENTSRLHGDPRMPGRHRRRLDTTRGFLSGFHAQTPFEDGLRNTDG